MVKKKTRSVETLEREYEELQKKLAGKKTEIREAKQRKQEEDRKRDAESKTLLSECLAEMLIGKSARTSIASLDVEAALTIVQLAIGLAKGVNPKLTAIAVRKACDGGLIIGEATSTMCNRQLHDLHSRFAKGENPFAARAAEAIEEAKKQGGNADRD